MNLTLDNLTNGASQIIEQLTGYLPRLLAAVLILGITVLLARRLERVVRMVLTRARLPGTVVGLLSSLGHFTSLVIGLIFILQTLGLSQAVYGTVASLGILGLIVGFALQDVTRQFAAGMMLLVARPFQVGDMVKIRDYEGTVVDIQLRATVLKTVDSAEVLIPNADVYTSTIINTSRYGLRRQLLQVALPASADLAAVRARLVQATAAVPGVAADPPPTAVLLLNAEARVTAELRYWIASQRADSDDIVTQVTIAARGVLEDQTPDDRAKG